MAEEPDAEPPTEPKPVQFRTAEEAFGPNDMFGHYGPRDPMKIGGEETLRTSKS